MGLQPDAYVLCVGTLEPRKNLITLFEAYARLPAALRAQYPLVLAGMKGWHTEALMSSAQALLADKLRQALGNFKAQMQAAPRARSATAPFWETLARRNCSRC